MSDSQLNPYRSPAAVIEDAPKTTSRGWFDFPIVAWTIVFGLNLIVPLFFGLMLASAYGLAGILVAVVSLHLSGWWFCAAHPALGRRLIAGSIAVALTQIVPIAQIFVGLVALGLARELGLVGAFKEPGSLSGLGGLMVTMLVGGFFMLAAFGLGCVLAFFVPVQWFDPPTANGKIEPA